MPWMKRGDRRKDIPSDVVSVWEESGWKKEDSPSGPKPEAKTEQKPVDVKTPESTPISKGTPEKK